ncbi:MAG: AAA family ATPase [bacterium]|nr:AAA family ATPase [bacterium]
MSSKLKTFMDEFAPKPTRFIQIDVYTLALIWGGGLPVGKLIEMHGAGGVGKTTISLQIALALLKQGLAVFYLDVENSLDDDLKAKMGLLEYEQQERENGLPMFGHIRVSTFNKIDEILREVLTKEADYALVIFDSLTMAIPDRSKNAKKKAQISDEDAGKGARVRANFLKQYKPLLYQSETTMIVLNQMRVSLKGFKGTPQPAGGKALEHATDIRTALWRTGNITDPDDENMITGTKLQAATIKNKIAMPHFAVPVHFLHGIGVDNLLSVTQLLRDREIIQSSKSGWYTVVGTDDNPAEPEVSLRGLQKVHDWVKANAGMAVAWLKEFKC